MTISLKNTIIASSLLAGLLNLGQFMFTYNQQAKAAFAPSWAEAATPHPIPSPATAIPQVKNIPTATPVVATTVVPPNPLDDAVTNIARRLNAAGLKSIYAANYLIVQNQTGTPWQLLAAVHETETGQSGNTGRMSSAGAIGPMQFMPATFAHYAVDGDGNGTTDITSFADSLRTAGRYLAAGGADKGRYTTALFNYNHSNSYVTHVMNIAHQLGL